MVEESAYVPVILIGAGRSGTNMLRDALVKLPGAGTWPCDEINYIWRHGNARHPHDEFTDAMARPRVRRFVRLAFDRLARKRDLSHVIEKTCANSLRVGFVNRIFPQARFVFLVRDGRDVTASAIERWQAPLDPGYIARKARFVPFGDIFYYAMRYLWNRIHRLTSGERRLVSWGPRFVGMHEAALTSDLTCLCARQWARCVDKADEDLAATARARVYRLRYEDFVSRPASILGELAEFLDIDVDDAALQRSVSHVSAARVGGWRDRLSEEQARRIAPILAQTLARHGYTERD